MKIDVQRSDFVTQGELHLLVQEVLPEEMADAELFLGPAPPARAKSEQTGN
jgi:hypothetical protein